MTSRSSFWIDLKENSKRRLWPFAVFTVILFFVYPIMISMDLRPEEIENNGRTLLEAQRNTTYLLGYNPFTSIFAIAAAIICAVQGFGYLYHRDRVDMMQSQPVSPARRFFVIYVNGILVYLIPNLVMVLLGNVVAGALKCLSPWTTLYSMWSIGTGLLVFLVVYHMTILAVMLTGNLIITLLGTATFLGYELMLRLILNEMHSLYFASYVTRYDQNVFEKSITTPFSAIYRLHALIDNILLVNEINGETIWRKLIVGTLPAIGILLAQIIIYFALAWIAYRKRPMEAAGRAMAFEKSKGIIKALLILLGALVFLLIMKSLAQDTEVYALIGLIAGILIMQVLMETIFEYDFKAFAKRKRWFALGAVMTVGCYLFFMADLSGYDRYVPSVADVDHVSIRIGFQNSNDIIYLYDNYKDYSYGNSYAYGYGDRSFDLLDEMKLTDPGTIAAVISLAQKSMDGTINGEDTDKYGMWSTVKYTLKNGKEVCRALTVYSEESEDELNSIFADRTYQDSYYQMDDETIQVLSASVDQIQYTNGLEYTTVNIDPKTFQEAYRNDLHRMSYSSVKGEVPIGIVTMDIKMNRNYITKQFPVFETYQETIAYLRGEGLSLKWEAQNIVASQVKVINYDVPDVEYFEDYPSVVYTDPVQMSEILNACVPYSLIYSAYDTERFNDLLDVEVSDRREAVETVDSFELIPELVPAFVKSDLGIE
ncbi:MAG: DUF6449 domain-containing protein [Lachnospiraceae bacterium]|nr:DUF6449 domain-containing protein [Lachnospiraceae bacterium]